MGHGGWRRNSGRGAKTGRKLFRNEKHALFIPLCCLWKNTRHLRGRADLQLLAVLRKLPPLRQAAQVLDAPCSVALAQRANDTVHDFEAHYGTLFLLARGPPPTGQGQGRVEVSGTIAPLLDRALARAPSSRCRAVRKCLRPARNAAAAGAALRTDALQDCEGHIDKHMEGEWPAASCALAPQIGACRYRQVHVILANHRDNGVATGRSVLIIGATALLAATDPLLQGDHGIRCGPLSGHPQIESAVFRERLDFAFCAPLGRRPCGYVQLEQRRTHRGKEPLQVSVE
jgi:hypothetical protein